MSHIAHFLDGRLLKQLEILPLCILTVVFSHVLLCVMYLSLSFLFGVLAVFVSFTAP